MRSQPPPTFPPARAAPRWAWLPLARRAPAEPVARQWIGGLLGRAPEALPLTRNPHGRPMFGPPLQHLDCNWSHSGDGLLVVLAEERCVGIDLEWVKPRPNALALARRYFHASEAAWLAAMQPPEREAAFLRLWCAKEAMLKAHGRGLAFGLDRLALQAGPGGLQVSSCAGELGAADDWSLLELTPAPGYVGALAWRCR